MSDLPTGTVTFLFTDIEGSTRLAQDFPDSWGSLQQRHHQILQAAIESQNGHVFQIVGDAFCASFGIASDALNASILAQKQLIAEDWGQTPIKVRMGIHSGNADIILPAGDYTGYLTLSRVNRLMSAGHGGQILISQASRDLVRDNLPGNVFLLDLGEQRLKDLTYPEHIYQVVAPGIELEFPPLKTLTAQLNNLPDQPTPFIGREREISAILGLLHNPQVRLITLSGPGGTGKTRLALQVGVEILDEFDHGVWFVDLSSYKDPNLLLPAIAATLKVREGSGSSILQALTGYLSQKKLLLILDNFEQIVSAAPKLGSLLSASPTIKILVSSREVLRLRGEHDYPVPPLGLPQLRRNQTAAVLAQFEAVALFVQHAKSANPNFKLDEDNAQIVAQICTRLDGLPLAIELAAARSRLLKPAAMLEKLKHRLDTLTGGARDLPSRQQTIRGTIDWSYELLDEAEKVFFARMGIFAGGCTLETAEAICGQGLNIDILSLLESLIDKSLIREMDSISGEARFTMLETVREYAYEKLSLSGELPSIQKSLVEVLGGLLDKTLATQGGPEEVASFTRLDDELDNLRTMMEWSLANNQPWLAFKVSRLWEYWGQRVNKLEPLHWIEKALSLESNATQMERAYAYNGAGNLEMGIGEWHRAEKHYETALELFRSQNLRDGMSRCLNNLGNIAKNDKGFEKARVLYEESLKYHNPGTFTHSLTLLNLGNLARIRGDWQEAKKYFIQALDICQRLGADAGLSYAEWYLGVLALVQLDLSEAMLRFSNAARANYVQTNPIMSDYYTGWMGYVYLLGGEETKARNMLATGREALSEFLRTGTDIVDMWFIADGQARIELSDGNLERAAQLFGISWAWRLKDDYPLTESERPGHEACLTKLRRALGETGFQEAFQKGQALSIRDAIAFAAKS